MNKLSILAFGAHPDDVELGCGGTLLSHISQGKKVGIVDLTRGELGTRGTPEIRSEESAEAAKIIGVEIRENLGFEDGFFENSKENQLKVIEVIRKYQPDIVIASAIEDRHPDHGRASKLISDSCFLSGLLKIKTATAEPWRPNAVYHYIQFRSHITPNLVVDISDFHEKKMEAIKMHKSQFYDPDSNEPETMIAQKGFLEFIEARALEYGTQIGVKYGEGFTAERYIGVKDLSSLL
ncbi:MAG: bacillithiol biosynthesis deacetylase BshB1 [Bacteroidetes bacterium]|nr:bacillithiol biosynthesis deacetylase BshB1 [Bacteroidia bacterium]MBL4715962.1 bacillithiol biosynthesis deacetylase BshB1 [Bacteroidia bacterium]PCH69273.1 MAG: bacillithiol biosynthesis deacetylase BshB1 [Bacteroidota bacterium]